MLLALQGGKLLHKNGLRSNTYFHAGQILKKGFRGFGGGGERGGGGGGGREVHTDCRIVSIGFSVGERRAQ